MTTVEEINKVIGQVRTALSQGTYRTMYEAGNSYQSNLEKLDSIDQVLNAALKGDRAKASSLLGMPEGSLKGWQSSTAELRVAWDAKYAAYQKQTEGGPVGGGIPGASGASASADTARAEWLRQLQAEDAAEVELEEKKKAYDRAKRASPQPQDVKKGRKGGARQKIKEKGGKGHRSSEEEGGEGSGEGGAEGDASPSGGGGEPEGGEFRVHHGGTRTAKALAKGKGKPKGQPVVANDDEEQAEELLRQLQREPPPQVGNQRDAKAHGHHLGERGCSLANLMHPTSTMDLEAEVKEDIDTLEPAAKKAMDNLASPSSPSSDLLAPGASGKSSELQTFATHSGCWFAALPSSVLIAPSASASAAPGVPRVPTCRLRPIDNSPMVEVLFTQGVPREVAGLTNAPAAKPGAAKGQKPQRALHQAAYSELTVESPLMLPSVTMCSVTTYRVVVAALLQPPVLPTTAATAAPAECIAMAEEAGVVARAAAADGAPMAGQVVGGGNEGRGIGDDDEDDEELVIQDTTSDMDPGDAVAGAGENDNDEPWHRSRQQQQASDTGAAQHSHNKMATQRQPGGSPKARNALAGGNEDDDDDEYDVLQGLSKALVQQHLEDEMAGEDAALGAHARARDLPTEVFFSLTHWTTLSDVPWVVLMCHGGYFAGAVFEHMRPVVHKAFHRYVVRKKQGGKQSSHDKGGGSMSSVGSQLRRHHELKWKSSVRDVLLAWKPLIDRAWMILYVAPGPDNRAILTDFSELPASAISTSATVSRTAASPINLKDPRVRSVPLTTKRPTFNEVCRIFEEMATITIRYKELRAAQ